MKVLHVITGLDTGGAEQALFKLLAGGLADRFESTVVSLSDAGTYGARIEALGVPVHALGMRRGVPGPGVLSRLRNIVRQGRPDLIQGWMYHGNLAAWLACRMSLGRLILAWSIRQSLYGLSGEKLLTRQVIRANRLLSSSPDALLYNSELSLRQHEAFGFDSRRASVIANGFDLKIWQSADSARRREIRESLQLPSAAFVLGHVARWHPVKDHLRFVRVAARLAEVRPDLHIVMAGSGVEADNSALHAAIPTCLRTRFHLLGERADVHDWMSGLDVLCQSSRSEAFPNVLGEAMASGVPCVATDVGDSRQLLGGIGARVSPEDDESLHDGLSRMLDHPPAIREAMGRAARARIESEYSLGVMVDRYAALYESLLDGSHR